MHTIRQSDNGKWVVGYWRTIDQRRNPDPIFSQVAGPYETQQRAANVASFLNGGHPVDLDSGTRINLPVVGVEA